MPYTRSTAETLSGEMGMLKVKEGVKLLLHTMPRLKDFLFDFSEPHKIDLEKFMLSNFHFNVPVEKFAQLTGRSLAAFKRDFQKIFGMPPRHWLQDKTADRGMASYRKTASKAIRDLSGSGI